MDRTKQPIMTAPLEALASHHDPERDVFQALVLAQVSRLLSTEQHIIRRVRLLTRAAAAMISGSGVFYQYVRSQQLLVPMAIITDATQPPEPFKAAISGIITIPQSRPLRLGEGIAGYAATHRDIIMIDARYPHPTFTPTVIAHDADVFGFYPQVLICLPCCNGDELIGVVAVAQTTITTTLTAHTLDFLQGIAGQLGVVLAHEQITASDDERRSLHQAQEDERKRLARDLHDGPAQSISNAVMSLEYIDHILQDHTSEARIELRRLHTRLTQTMRELRTVMFTLRPLALEAEGLSVALLHLGEQYSDGPLQVQIHCEVATRLPETLETGIYIIIREALHNVYKHADATQCLVAVSQQPQRLTVLVHDNGKGFDYDQVLQHYPHGQSWGLMNIYERARLLNATITIRTSLGQGTRIELAFTLP